MKRLISFYHPKQPIYLTYMLQKVEYSPSDYFRWLVRFPNLRSIMYRQTLVWTSKAKLLVIGLFGLLVSMYAIVIALILNNNFIASLFVFLATPLILAALLYLIVGLAWVFIEKPRRTRQIKSAQKIFDKSDAKKIAILGSYGKTTVKELLKVVLSESMNVAATPGNKNVAISHARFANKLDGSEDVLLVEYGESEPGDIEKFAKLSSPDIAILTGIAPNHLDRYKTVANLADDLLSISEKVSPENIYANSEIKDFDKNNSTSGFKFYDEKGTNKVVIDNVKIDFTGMSFTANIKGSKKIELKTKLLGAHLLGPLAVCIQIAYELGLSEDEIKLAVAKTEPFEHRLQPRNINGAWIIDDTYNGSIEGLRAGLSLLKEIESKRKIYVTPGLVDQGEETESVHTELGKLIAEASPDKVVLINNSVTDIITKSLKFNNFSGKLEICDNPLEFYLNLEHILAAGDVALLQNDWTDNYY